MSRSFVAVQTIWNSLPNFQIEFHQKTMDLLPFLRRDPFSFDHVTTVIGTMFFPSSSSPVQGLESKFANSKQFHEAFVAQWVPQKLKMP
jgi:hypothetical protein